MELSWIIAHRALMVWLTPTQYYNSQIQFKNSFQNPVSQLSQLSNSNHLKGSDSAPSLGHDRGLLARGQPESDLPIVMMMMIMLVIMVMIMLVMMMPIMMMIIFGFQKVIWWRDLVKLCIFLGNLFRFHALGIKCEGLNTAQCAPLSFIVWI